MNVQGVREVPKERNVWILKDRFDKRREKSVVRRFICAMFIMMMIIVILINRGEIGRACS